MNENIKGFALNGAGIVVNGRAMPVVNLPKALSVDDHYRRQLHGCRSWFPSGQRLPVETSVISVTHVASVLSPEFLECPNARKTKHVWETFLEDVRNGQREIKFTPEYGVGLYLGPSAQTIPKGTKVLVDCHVLVALNKMQHEYLKNSRRDISVYGDDRKRRQGSVNRAQVHALLGPKGLINASCGKCATVKDWLHVTVCKAGGLKPGDQVLINYAPTGETWTCPSCAAKIEDPEQDLGGPNQATDDSSQGEDSDDSTYTVKPLKTPANKRRRSNLYKK